MAFCTRRSFLAASASSAALMHGSFLARTAHGLEPIARPVGGSLKLALSAYSFRQCFGFKPQEKGYLDMPGFLDYCVGLGFDGAELTQYFFPDPVDTPYLLNVKRHAHLAGIDISGGAIGNNFTVEPGEALDKQLAYTRTWIDHYADLGAPVVRVFAGNPPAGVSVSVAIDRAVVALRQACEYASQRGVILAIENHDFGTDADRLLEIVRQVESPWFGVNFDSGNFSQTADPYAGMKKLAPYAVNAQLKITVTGPSGGERADLPRIIGLLKDSGYAGYVVLEFEENEDPYEGVPRFLAQVRPLVG